MNSKIKTTLIFSFIFVSAALLNTTRVHAKTSYWFTDEEAAKKLGTPEEKGLSMWQKFKGKRFIAARKKENKKLESAMAEQVTALKTTRAIALKAVRDVANEEKDCTINQINAEFKKIYQIYKTNIQAFRDNSGSFEASHVPKILKSNQIKDIKTAIETHVNALESVIIGQEKQLTKIIEKKKNTPLLTVPDAHKNILGSDDDNSDDDNNTKALLEELLTKPQK